MKSLLEFRAAHSSHRISISILVSNSKNLLLICIARNQVLRDLFSFPPLAMLLRDINNSGGRQINR